MADELGRVILRAPVRRVTGKAFYGIGGLDADGKFTVASACPPPAYVAAIETPMEYYLIQFTETGEEITDDWFADLDELKAHARLAFDIQEDDWVECCEAY